MARTSCNPGGFFVFDVASADSNRGVAGAGVVVRTVEHLEPEAKAAVAQKAKPTTANRMEKTETRNSCNTDATLKHNSLSIST